MIGNILYSDIIHFILEIIDVINFKYLVSTIVYFNVVYSIVPLFCKHKIKYFKIVEQYTPILVYKLREESLLGMLGWD